MRIRRITFYNINNLKGGPHEISFEREPLSSTAIFAITGPTGSGKSTILDVITLALYNRIPRHGKVSKNAILDQGSVITHHAQSASAEVEYEVEGLKYISTWSVEVARTGNLKDYEMSLIDPSGNYIDIKKSQVPDKNAEIIGLNYDQFVKSIILSQGEFARFLKSDKNERGEMLEKLTGTDIYRKLGSKAYEKAKEIKRLLRFEEDLVGEMKLMDQESLKHLEQELSEAKEYKRSLDKKITFTSSLVQTKERQQVLRKKLKVVESELALCEARLTDLKGQKAALHVHDEVSKLAKEIALFQKSEQGIRESELFIKDQQMMLSKAQLALKDALKEMSEFVHEQVDLDTYVSVKEHFEKLVQDYDYELKATLQEGKRLRTEINQKLADLSLDIEFDKDPTKAKNQILEHLVKLETIFSEAGLSQEDDHQAVHHEIKKLIERTTRLEKLVQLEKNMRELELDINVNQKASEIDSRQLSSLQNLFDKQSALLNSFRQEMKLLMKQKEDAIKIASLEKLRSELKDGEACPLCGSLEHPYSDHVDFQLEDELSQRISEKEKSIAVQEQEWNTLSRNINQLIARLKMNTDQVDASRKKLKDLTNQFDKVREDLREDFEDPETYLKEVRALLLKKEEGLSALMDWKLLNQIISLYDQLGVTINSYKKLDQKRKSKFKGDQVSVESKKIEQKIQEHVNLSNKAEAFIEDRKRSMVNFEKQKSELSKKLNAEIQERGLHKVEELAKLLLSKEEAEKIRSELKSAHERKLMMTAEKQSIEKELDQVILRDTKQYEDLEQLRQELTMSEMERDKISASLGEFQAMLKQEATKRDQVQERQKRISHLRKENEKWALLKDFIGSAKGDVFANFAQGLTLKNLLAHANRRLQDLTDRYLLNKPGNDGTLSIIDRYQGNIERAVTTLSGGEVFIISLALALSLSDMASKNIALESLFIDEGFGTLDQETLDVAMSTLESLQSESRKIVGVISHVEALKERITTQIQLKKNAQGYSTIEITS
ncbi:AAA family ATPase [Portibacter marinus]|uniref:AAA family ATPase n=1 Tax=Portibacter marinus TaxID=2898660 RepID=UPI001F47B3B4|nr:AAA family ATPase [Portibacter marinus]